MTDTDNTNATLVDALDVVIDKGAVLHGDAVIRIADLDMIAISIRVIIVSMSKLQTQQGKRVDDVHVNELGDEIFLLKLEKQKCGSDETATYSTSFGRGICRRLFMTSHCDYGAQMTTRELNIIVFLCNWCTFGVSEAKTCDC